MKKKQQDYYSEVFVILKELNKKFPSYNMGRHLATALDGYTDFWGITDKELVFALTKYKIQLELDEPHLTQDEDLAEIIKGGMNLTLINEDDYLGKE
jgi:hypothetical protein